MKTPSPWRKPAPPPPGEAIEPPPRPRIPYGLHPLIDLQLLMHALADNQLQLAKGLRWQCIAMIILALSVVLSGISRLLP
jgi:hypothetical protein